MSRRFVGFFCSDIRKGIFFVFLFFCVAYIGLGFVRGFEKYQFWNKRRFGASIPIRAIVQTGPQKEVLKTAYFAELLELSSDVPTLTENFNVKEAEKKLFSSAVMKECFVKIKEPGVVYIDYTIRQPVALLYDYPNVAIDAEGFPFPIHPFFSPKKLPEIYLNLEEPLKWNQPLRGEKVLLSLKLLHLLRGPLLKDLFNVARIDVSNAFKPSCGRQEIVLLTEDEILIQEATNTNREAKYRIPRLLRLSAKKYSQELGNYLKLRTQLLVKEKKELEELLKKGPSFADTKCKGKVIDFRISQLAFIEDIE